MNKTKSQFVGTGSTNNRNQEKELVAIQGILTSRIETRKDKTINETYYYGFFKLKDYEQDIPVIFKNQEGSFKPTLTKGSIVLLEGNWSESYDSDRPSFTCSTFKIINSESELNLYQKLHLLQSQTGQISKTELNKFQNYKYFTEQQTLNILKPLLTEQKLTLTFSDNPTVFTKEKPEKEWVISYLKQAILTNSEDPQEQLTFHFWAIGANSDPAKAKGCAETYAIKYFLTKFFLIPTTDELDPDITKPYEYANRLKSGKQETPEEIIKRHEEKDRKRESELKQKYGLDWKLSQEYKSWRGGN